MFMMNKILERDTVTLVVGCCGNKQTGSGICELHTSHASSSIAHYKHSMVEPIWVKPVIQEGGDSSLSGITRIYS